MNRLAHRIVARIRAGGPISVADYMAMALGDPEEGYYRSREPFGAAGDFVTAPEISQIFGELLGAWAIATWEAMGAPGRVVLVELGPGRGTLMADMLRVARLRPAFVAAIDVHLVETSMRLRAMQKAALGAASNAARWHDAAETLPNGPAIIIANEFFDALPVHQFVRRDGTWRERMVGIGEGAGFAFVEGPEAAVGALPALSPPEGAIFETRPEAEAIAARLAGRLVRDGGALLAIDYGHDQTGFGDTFQAVKGHAFADPLADPGEADLTSHVDFAALARAASGAGAEVFGPIGQGEFLTRLGLRQRAARLASGKPDQRRAAIAADTDRLAGEGPAAMGRLFRVLAVAAPGLSLPGF